MVAVIYVICSLFNDTVAQSVRSNETVRPADFQGWF